MLEEESESSLVGYTNTKKGYERTTFEMPFWHNVYMNEQGKFRSCETNCS